MTGSLRVARGIAAVALHKVPEQLAFDMSDERGGVGLQESDWDGGYIQPVSVGLGVFHAERRVIRQSTRMAWFAFGNCSVEVGPSLTQRAAGLPDVQDRGISGIHIRRGRGLEVSEQIDPGVCDASNIQALFPRGPLCDSVVSHALYMVSEPLAGVEHEPPPPDLLELRRLALLGDLPDYARVEAGLRGLAAGAGPELALGHGFDHLLGAHALGRGVPQHDPRGLHGAGLGLLGRTEHHGGRCGVRGRGGGRGRLLRPLAGRGRHGPLGRGFLGGGLLGGLLRSRHADSPMGALKNKARYERASVGGFVLGELPGLVEVLLDIEPVPAADEHQRLEQLVPDVADVAGPVPVDPLGRGLLGVGAELSLDQPEQDAVVRSAPAVGVHGELFGAFVHRRLLAGRASPWRVSHEGRSRAALQGDSEQVSDVSGGAA